MIYHCQSLFKFGDIYKDLLLTMTGTAKIVTFNIQLYCHCIVNYALTIN